MDNEVKGVGSHLSFGDNGYDPRLVRRFNIDPVVKHHESPYAAFANNPLLFIDPSGNDTLVVHRSGKIVSMSDGNADVYLVTFSVIENGVERSLSQRMFMVGDKEADLKGNNDLNDKKNHTLNWRQLNKHSGREGWENTIQITENGSDNFLHPAGDIVQDLEGCYALNCDAPSLVLELGDEKYYGISYPNSIESLGMVRDMYNEANGGEDGGKLTGDKFIMTIQSEAPMKRMESLPARSLPTKEVKGELKTNG